MLVQLLEKMVFANLFDTFPLHFFHQIFVASKMGQHFLPLLFLQCKFPVWTVTVSFGREEKYFLKVVEYFML